MRSGQLDAAFVRVLQTALRALPGTALTISLATPSGDPSPKLRMLLAACARVAEPAPRPDTA